MQLLDWTCRPCGQLGRAAWPTLLVGATALLVGASVIRVGATMLLVGAILTVAEPTAFTSCTGGSAGGEAAVVNPPTASPRDR